MAKCLTVTVLTHGEYSDYRIYGVFSSKEKAEEYAKLHGIPEDGYGEFGFEEYDLDGPLLEQWQDVFICQMDVDGNILQESVGERELRSPRWSEVEHSHSSCYYAKSVVGVGHARKLCAEARQQWLREHPDAKYWWLAHADNNGLARVGKYQCGDEADLLEALKYQRSESWKNAEGLSHHGISVISAEDALAKVGELQRKAETGAETA